MLVAAGGFGPGGKKQERSTGGSREGLSYPGGKFGEQALAHPVLLLGMKLSTGPDPSQVPVAKTLPEVRENQTQPLTHRWPPPRSLHQHMARGVPEAPLHEKSQPTATRDGVTSAAPGLPSPKPLVQTQNELEARRLSCLCPAVALSPRLRSGLPTDVFTSSSITRERITWSLQSQPL